ncbi:hypothetical protein SAMN05421736_1533, partial [Evansella caseinilytica]
MNLLKNLQKYFVILVVLLIFGGNSVYANDAGSGDSSEETLMKVKELNVNIVELDETLSAATGDFVIASKPLLQRIQVGGGSGIGSARSGGIKNGLFAIFYGTLDILREYKTIICISLASISNLKL